LVVVRVRLTTV